MSEVTISAYQFMKMFPNEQSARIYLEKRRWNGKPTCPSCKSEHIQVRKVSGYYRCLACKNDFTVRTGTVMERSHIPLDKWIYTMYLLVTARKGVSSLQLSKELGITQKSAWFMLHRLREACKDDKDLLSGIIEADETYIGGKESNKHNSKKLKAGRGTIGKTAVLGMRERNGNVRAMIVEGTDTKCIQEKDQTERRVCAERSWTYFRSWGERMGQGNLFNVFLRKPVAQGSTLCTDEHAAYNGMPEFTHLKVNHSAKEFVNGVAYTNGIESVWSVLKRGYYGVYHNFSTKHLPKYISEFSFRLNEGNCKIPSMDRVNSLIEGILGKRLTYEKLTARLEF